MKNFYTENGSFIKRFRESSQLKEIGREYPRTLSFSPRLKSFSGLVCLIRVEYVGSNPVLVCIHVDQQLPFRMISCKRHTFPGGDFNIQFLFGKSSMVAQMASQIFVLSFLKLKHMYNRSSLNVQLSQFICGTFLGSGCGGVSSGNEH